MKVVNRQAILDRYCSVAEKGRPYTWLNYQPINLPGYEPTLPLAGRCCFDRLRAVADHLDTLGNGTRLRIIDWGCGLGFFCFELAKLGHEVVGVDRNREYVQICRHLADGHAFPVTPRFYCDELGLESLPNYSGFDLALCFSVFHHLGKQRMTVLKSFAETYPRAYLEMDGPGLGYDLMFPFYWDLVEIVETNDRYGKGTRRRKTWYGSNSTGDAEYKNIKQRNLIGGRGVFLKRRPAESRVVKRELKSSGHTWICTNLEHEIEMYRRCSSSRFFPTLLAAGATDSYRWMEIEHVSDDKQPSTSELRHFYNYLQRERLFLMDVCSDSFLFVRGKLRVIDLESLFPIETTLDDLIAERSRRGTVPFPSYEMQLEHLERRLAR